MNVWIRVGLVLAALASAVAYGHHMGWSSRDAQAIEELLAATKAQLTRLHAETAAREAAEARVADLGAQLEDERFKSHLVFRTIREEVPRVVDHYIPGPGLAPAPLPDCVFTGGFVGVWNAALFADGSAGAAPGTSGAAAGSNTAALEDSGVTERELLDNHVDNAEADNACRARVAGWERYWNTIKPKAR